MKKLIYIVGAVVAAIVAVFFGFREMQQVKKLKAEGKQVTAEVTNAEEKRGRRGRRSYYLTVKFNTEAGQVVQDESKVAKSVYEAAVSAKTAPVTYLASDPSVYRVGSEVKAGYGGFIAGGVCLVFAAVMAFRRSSG